MLKSANIYDYVIIGMYFFVMILCGALLTRLNRSDKDYFKASGKIPWPMASLSIFIGAFSAYMFVAASGQVYKCGIPAFLIFCSTSLGHVFAALYFAKKFRRTRITSPMEYIELRFGRITKNVVTYLQMPIYLLLTGNLLYVLCIFISSALGLKDHIVLFGHSLSGLHIAMIFTGSIVVIYTAIGGLWAVVVTDTVQFIIAMVASVLLAVFSCIAFANTGSFIGNFQTFLANPPSEGYFHIANSYQPLSFTLAWVTLMIFSQPGHLQLIQRCACVPDEKDAQKCSWLSVVFFIVCPIIWLFPVFILRNQLPDMAVLWPHLKNPTEASYVTIALQLLPNGMIGLVISAILAASISSMAGCFNMISVIFTNDVYHKVINREASHRTLMIIGKLTSAGVGIMAVLIGIILSGFSDAFRTTFTIVSHTGLAMALPIVFGFIFKRVPWWSGIAAMIACFIATLSIELGVPLLAVGSSFPLWTHILGHLFEYKVFGAIIVSLLVFVVSRLFYKRERVAEGTVELFRRLETPVSEDHDYAPVVAPDMRAYRVVAISLAIFAVPLLAFDLFRVVEDHQAVNTYAGMIFLILSMVIFWLTDKRISPFEIIRAPVKHVGDNDPGNSQNSGVQSKK